MIYLDNAATSWPKPDTVYEAVVAFMREKGANPGRSGYDMAVAAEKVIDDTRTALARLFNAPDAKDIVFTLNCTDSLNLALKGLLRRGHHVISDSIGHNSLVRPLKRLEQQGVAVTRIPPGDADGAVSPLDVEAAITPATRLIAITHASNVGGVIQPVAAIGEIARKHNVFLLVDAAQSAGALEIDVQAANIDLLAFSGHKGLLGPMGTGGLYVGQRVDLEQVREGGTGTFSESEEQPLERPNRYESGTPNAPGIAGLGAGLQYLVERTIADVRKHESMLLAHLLDGMAAISGVTVYGPRDRSKRISIAPFTVEGWSPGEVATVLDSAFEIKVRAGLHCAPAAHKVLGTFPKGCVRVGIGCFNTSQDIDDFLHALKEIAHSEPLW